MRMIATMILLVGLSGFAIPQGKVVQDVPADIQRAHQALDNAKQELQNAGNEWGGHRVKAIGHVDGALAEIKNAEAWARQHHELKQ